MVRFSCRLGYVGEVGELTRTMRAHREYMLGLWSKGKKQLLAANKLGPACSVSLCAWKVQRVELPDCAESSDQKVDSKYKSVHRAEGEV